MRTAGERLAFAVRFAQMNLDQFSYRDWLDLKDEITAFLGLSVEIEGQALHARHSLQARGEVFVDVTEPPLPAAMTERDVRVLQQDMRTLLTGVVSGRAVQEGKGPATPLRKEDEQAFAEHWATSGEALGWTGGREKGPVGFFPDYRHRVVWGLRGTAVLAKFPLFTLGVQYGLIPAPPPFATRNALFAAGSTRDTFLLTLFFLLAREPTDKIRMCPECHALFLRVRKQQYCSRRCVKRVNMRTWRASRAQAARKEKQRKEALKARQGRKEK